MIGPPREAQGGVFPRCRKDDLLMRTHLASFPSLISYI